MVMLSRWPDQVVDGRPADVELFGGGVDGEQQRRRLDERTRQTAGEVWGGPAAREPEPLVEGQCCGVAFELADELVRGGRFHAAEATSRCTRSRPSTATHPTPRGETCCAVEPPEPPRRRPTLIIWWRVAGGVVGCSRHRTRHGARELIGLPGSCRTGTPSAGLGRGVDPGRPDHRPGRCERPRTVAAAAAGSSLRGSAADAHPGR